MTIEEWDIEMKPVIESIQNRIDLIREYFTEDYQVDNIDILNTRFSKCTVYAAEMPELQRKANKIRDQKLKALMIAGKTPTLSKVIASTEVQLSIEVTGVTSVISQAHRTLQSQISAWKEEFIKNKMQ